MRLVRKSILITFLFLTWACQPVDQPASSVTLKLSPPPSVTAVTPTPFVYLTSTPGYPDEGFGPVNFPIDINPLTGLSTDPVLLDRRPVIVKVSNLPRNVRPQFGLSLADIVYEYYTEEGTTRFAAIYYSQDASKVGSIRSARFFDENIIRMYKGIFIFGGADQRVLDRLYESDFADRLILEWQAGCPAMCRPDPVTNFLIADIPAVRKYAHTLGISDERQNLEGMRFRLQPPEGGQPGAQVYTWYSAVIYNCWDYDPPTGRYYRYVDVDNALDGQPEVYAPLRDALTDVPISADNIVILLMPHDFYSMSPEIVEMEFAVSGPAYTLRDGQAYALQWIRPSDSDVVYLSTESGAVFPLRPGRT